MAWVQGDMLFFPLFLGFYSFFVNAGLLLTLQLLFDRCFWPLVGTCFFVVFDLYHGITQVEMCLSAAPFVEDSPLAATLAWVPYMHSATVSCHSDPLASSADDQRVIVYGERLQHVIQEQGGPPILVSVSLKPCSTQLSACLGLLLHRHVHGIFTIAVTGRAAEDRDRHTCQTGQRRPPHRRGSP
jgi:hypothetical protein